MGQPSDSGRLRGPVRAEELIRRLEQDPAYVARERERLAEQQQNLEGYRRAISPLTEELAQRDVRIEKVSQLLQNRREHKLAIPTLLKWLPAISYPPAKEDIVRTLSVPWAGAAAAQVLIAEFKRTASSSPPDGLRWTIANALAVIADDSILDALEELVEDRQHGKAREMLAVALGQVNSPRAVSILLRLLDDEETVGHAVIALGRLKAASAQPRLESLSLHPKRWVRNEVRIALAKIAGAKVDDSQE
jgi:HEAT repeat protein